MTLTMDGISYYIPSQDRDQLRLPDLAQSPQIILRNSVRWEHIVKLSHPANVHRVKLKNREMS